MSYNQFPSPFFIIAADSNETIKLGSFQNDENIELTNILIPIYKHGTAGGSESMTAKIYADSNYSVLLASSDAFLLSAVTGLTTYWIGNLRFDFSNYQINNQQTYYLGLSFSNYTRSADSYFIGAVMDTHNSINTQSDTNKPGIGFVIIGRK